MNKNIKIYIAGHNGMVGSAIYRCLLKKGFTNLLVASRNELDLTNQLAVQNFFKKHTPDHVFLAAAKVGGIHSNRTYPAEFIYSNLMVETNVIHQSFVYGVKKLLFLGSSCIYPRLSTQPIPEDALLTGQLEPTNEPYAIAKIAGIKLCESYNRQYKDLGIDYRSIMPTNLYGPNDNYDPKNGHVIPALIHKIYHAKISNTDVVIWGTGEARREFLYVDDLAEAAIKFSFMSELEYTKLTNPMCSHINVGYGEDITIAELAALIAKTIGYTGKIIFDKSYPDGTPKKLMSSKKIRTTGWAPKITLETGLKLAFQNYIENLNSKK